MSEIFYKNWKKALVNLDTSIKSAIKNLNQTALKICFVYKKKLQKNLNIKFQNKIIIVNYYPEILNLKKSLTNLKIILNVIKEFTKYVTIIFTLPSHDIENEKFTREIKNFCNHNINSFVFKNLGQKKYLSLLKISNLMIGNSSSGIYEMPSFRKFSINLGQRQSGRIASKSVINSMINYNILKKKSVCI